MPKSAGRRKRIRAARVDAAPTAVAEGSQDKQQKSKSKQGGKGTEGGAKEKELLPVLSKLQATEASERLWSTLAVSNILGTADSSTRRLLQSKNVVGLLIERLADEEVQVRLEACGALRNLAIEGGLEVCAEMFNKSIVPALAKHLEPLQSTITAVLENKPAKGEQERTIRKALWSWTENLSTLFWCLAETSDKSFKAVVAQGALSTLLYTILKNAIPTDGSSIIKSKIPLSVALAAAQAVYVLTDSNVPTAPKFPLPRDISKSAAYVNTRSMLLETLRSTTHDESKTSDESTENHEMFKVLTIGILQNLAQQQVFGKQAEPEEETEFNQMALKVLTSGLEGVSLSTDAASVSQAHQALPAAGSSKSAEAVAVSAQKVQLDKYEKRWTRLRLTLEILGELIAELDGIVDSGLLGEEEYEEWHGFSNGGQDQAMEEDVQTGEAGSSKAGQNQQKPSAISNDAMDVFARLPQTLLALAQATPISFATRSLTASTGASEGGLISTQPEGSSSAGHPNGSGTDAKYIPNLTELVTLVHSRALECLNNLLITVGRSGSAIDTAAAAEKEEDLVDAVDDSMALLDEEGDGIDEDDGAEEGMDADSEVGEGDMEDEGMDGHEEPADIPASVKQDALQAYVQNNLGTLQSAWESLFQLLVGYMSLLQAQAQGQAQQVTNGAAISGKGKKAAGSASAQYEDPVALSAEACLGSIWALGRVCVDRLTIGSDETSVLLSTLAAKDAGIVQVDSALRCAGALGVLASRRGVATEENKTIGTALLSGLAPLSQTGNIALQTNAEFFTQVIDSIIDIYSDETREYDETVFVKGDFLSALEGIAPAYKKLVKGIDKRKLPEVREVADGVASNLVEFVKYRKSL